MPRTDARPCGPIVRSECGNCTAHAREPMLPGLQAHVGDPIVRLCTVCCHLGAHEILAIEELA